MVPAIFPRPRHCELGGPLAEGARVVERQVEALPAQGYELDLGDSIELRYADPAGLRYGRDTLRQLRQLGLQAGRIRDWPELARRGFMLDISRDRVPTRATLERLVGLLEMARYNELQLYTEHTFAYRDHADVWRHASPMTPEDVRWLDERCRTADIELVANQNCFGHMGRWLSHEGYRHRAETPDGVELAPGKRMPPSVLAPTPANAAWVLGLLDELLPNFSARKVNIGCDETFELGHGISRDAVRARGVVDVFVEHLRRIVVPLVERGFEVQFWDDIARRDPTRLRTLPAGSEALVWTYEAPSAAAPAVHGVAEVLGYDPFDGGGFRTFVEPIAEVGFPFRVAPGTSSWNSLVGRVDNATANMVDACETGIAFGATGLLVTDWGDNGHLQPPSVSFGPLLYGGAVAWALEANRDLDVAQVLDTEVFGDPTGGLGGALDLLGRLWRRTGQEAMNASPLLAPLLPPGRLFVSGEPVLRSVLTTLAQIEEALTVIDAARPACPDGAVVAAELTAAARLARQGAWRLLDRAGGPAPAAKALAADLAEAIDMQAASWLARSRPGGLDDSLAALRRTLELTAG